jgi:hypothetical protein
MVCANCFRALHGDDAETIISAVLFLTQKGLPKMGNYQQRKAERTNTQQKGSIFELPYDQRAKQRRAEQQGREEGRRLARIAEQEKKKAELEATPEHERRPENIYRKMIEARKTDAWRKEVKPRLREYERLAKAEEARIDAEMADKQVRFELESSPEYAKALDHWQRASERAETPAEKAEWAKLKGFIEAGAFVAYYDGCAPIVQARLAKLQEGWDSQLNRQSEIVNETKALSEEIVEAEDLLPKPEAPEPEQPE